jgi:hypothetical protein
MVMVMLGGWRCGIGSSEDADVDAEIEGDVRDREESAKE